MDFEVEGDDSWGCEAYETLKNKIDNVKNICEKHENTRIHSANTQYCLLCLDCGEFLCNHSGLKETESCKVCNFKSCDHSDMFEDYNGLYICKKCGSEIEIPKEDAEWRYYSSEGGTSKDPSRCHKTRRISSIEVDLAKANVVLNKHILEEVKNTYNKITNGKTLRGSRRRHVLAASTYFINLKMGEYKPSEYYRDRFGLDKKTMSKGIHEYLTTFPEDRTIEVRPENLIVYVMNLANIDMIHYKTIIKFCKYLEDTSRMLKRCNPQSVIAAIVFFYICRCVDHGTLKLEEKLTKNQFADITGLSDITISKLVEELEKITGIEV